MHNPPCQPLTPLQVKSCQVTWKHQVNTNIFNILVWLHASVEGDGFIQHLLHPCGNMTAKKAKHPSRVIALVHIARMQHTFCLNTQAVPCARTQAAWAGAMCTRPSCTMYMISCLRNCNTGIQRSLLRPIRTPIKVTEGRLYNVAQAFLLPFGTRSSSSAHAIVASYQLHEYTVTG